MTNQTPTFQQIDDMLTSTNHSATMRAFEANKMLHALIRAAEGSEAVFFTDAAREAAVTATIALPTLRDMEVMTDDEIEDCIKEAGQAIAPHTMNAVNNDAIIAGLRAQVEALSEANHQLKEANQQLEADLDAALFDPAPTTIAMISKREGTYQVNILPPNRLYSEDGLHGSFETKQDANAYIDKRTDGNVEIVTQKAYYAEMARRRRDPRYTVRYEDFSYNIDRNETRRRLRRWKNVNGY